VPASLSRKLVRYFVLGVPAYRLRFEVSLALSTVLRIYRWILEAIYANSLQEWTLLGGLVEADQTIFGGRRAQVSEDGGQLAR
jgi:transposase